MQRQREYIDSRGRENNSKRLVKRFVPEDLEEMIIWANLSGQKGSRTEKTINKVKPLLREMRRNNIKYFTVVIMKNTSTNT